MILAADASFLVSLYGGDANTAAARAFMVSTAQPLMVSTALRFETENALRLARFRRILSASELAQALADWTSDVTLGILVIKEIPATRHWAECRRLSAAHTAGQGFRTFDILHVAGALLLKADRFLTFDHKQAALANLAGLAVSP